MIFRGIIFACSLLLCIPTLAALDEQTIVARLALLGTRVSALEYTLEERESEISRQEAEIETLESRIVENQGDGLSLTENEKQALASLFP